MSNLSKAIAAKIGEHRVHELPDESGNNVDLLLLEIESKVPIRLLMTDGLSNYKMPVPQRYEDRAYNELYFAIPSYWELDDLSNPNMNWPIEKIKKLTNHVIEHQTWYGPGHTFSNGNPPEPFSENMKQTYLLLADPIMVEDILQPFGFGEKTIHFLAIIPLFEEEFLRKQHIGHLKFIRKYRSRNGTELLDDYRESIFKSRWRIRS
jgi:hypothetical protein